MVQYSLRRILDSLPVLLGITILTYLLLILTRGDLLPGLELNRDIRPADLIRIKHQLGLDQPWWLQYMNWVGVAWIVKAIGLGAIFGDAPVSTGLLQGDFGRSLSDGSPVMTHILARLANTILLVSTAILLGVTIAIPMGVTGALRRGSRLDHFFTVFSASGISIPHFWLGLLLILTFSVSFQAWGLPWLPSGGAETVVGGGDPLDRIVHLVLPATVLATTYLAIWSRYMRSSTLEVLSQDFVRTARAKGMNERRVLYVHTLRNAFLPLVTLIGFELPGIFSGAGITEIVFSWPGIGRYALEAAFARDVTVLMALTTFTTILVVLGNLIADLLYAVVDPRIRYS